MKKLSVALVLVLASLALVACGGGGGTSTTESATSEPTESTEAETTEKAGGGSEAAESEEGEAEAETEGGGKAESGSASSAIDVEANPEGMLMFTTKSLSAKAGDDTVDFTNNSPVPHNVAIEDSSGKMLAETETIAEGTSSTKVELEPGTYTYFCTVPGHREAGMEGTLTVK